MLFILRQYQRNVENLLCHFYSQIAQLKSAITKQFTDFETLLQLDFFMPFFYLQLFFFFLILFETNYGQCIHMDN